MNNQIVERSEAVVFGGKKLTVLGRKLEVGDPAPDFSVTASNFTQVTLADSAGKIRLISVVPNLDTSVCDQQTRRFNEEASQFGDEVAIMTISAEHPINQKRWCLNAEVERIPVLSDHMDMNFGDAYGTHIRERRLEQRSVFVIDKHDKIAYVQYVEQTGTLPDFDKALDAVRGLLG